MLLFCGYFSTSLSICFLHCVSKNAWNLGTKGFSGAAENTSSNAIHQFRFSCLLKASRPHFRCQEPDTALKDFAPFGGSTGCTVDVRIPLKGFALRSSILQVESSVGLLLCQ